jgi:hypothetical protein
VRFLKLKPYDRKQNRNKKTYWKSYFIFLHERAWYKWIKFGVVSEKTKKKVKKEQSTEVSSVVDFKSTEPKKKTLNYSSKR